MTKTIHKLVTTKNSSGNYKVNLKVEEVSEHKQTFKKFRKWIQTVFLANGKTKTIKHARIEELSNKANTF